MTRLRKRMLEELQRRDYSHSTVRIYLHIVSDFARYFRRSPDTLGPEQIRQYQLHLFQKKMSPYTIRQHTAALRFFFFKTLHRNFLAFPGGSHDPISQKIKPLLDMDDPRLLWIQSHTQLFQYPSRSCQRSTRLSRRLTGDHPSTSQEQERIAFADSVLPS